MTLTELSIKRPLLITMVFLALILFGALSYMGLNYNLLPSFSTGTITIKTVLSGASPSEIQEKITRPVEDAISEVEGIDFVTSSSLQNVSSIAISLKPNVDDKQAQQDIERKINQMKSTLPDDIDEPVVNRRSTDDFAIMNLSVTASKLDGADFYDMVDKNIKPRLSNVQGVGQISIAGGQAKEVKIELDNTKLQYYNLSPKKVYQAIAANTSSLPGGNITNQQQHLSIIINGDYADKATFDQIVIADNGVGSRVMLTDIATISIGQQEIETLNRINGKPGIGIQVFKTNDANAVEVAAGIKKSLAELKILYKTDGFDYVIASDQSVYTLSSADAVMHDLFLAILIVGVVMLMFLHSVRSSLFVLIAIPSAMIPTFIVMEVMGFSLNLMTLLALSLVVGILVDDSIVVLENIFRHLEMGKDKRLAALEGRNEIGFTAVAITLVDVVVFLPMTFAGGLIGNILREFAVVVVVSTLMSLVVAFTVTPMLASRFAKMEHIKENTLWGKIILSFESFLNQLKDFYALSLRKALKAKRYLFAIILVLMIASIYLVPAGFIGSSFIGTNEKGELSIQLETASDMPIKETNLLTRKAEKILLGHPEVRSIYTLVGTQSGAKNNAENLSELSVSLVDKTQREFTTAEFGTIARDELSRIPGLQVTILPVSITGSSSAPIQIVVQGTNSTDVQKGAQLLEEAVRSTAGTDYVRFSTKKNQNQVQITPDREKIMRLGLSLPDVTQSIQLAFNGNDKLDFLQNGETYQINIGVNKQSKYDMESIENLSLINANGRMIKLHQVADVRLVNVPQILQRTNRQSSITINAAAVGRPSGDIVRDIKQKMTQKRLPAGVQVVYDGDSKNQGQAFASLGLALLIAIILVYMVMVGLYESLVHPFVVIFSVPVALIGALLALALTMEQLTIFTIIGMIMLMGLVTKNGILIVDFTNHLRDSGYNLTDALIEAGKERLRPIIMTTFAMILGMLPIALSQSPGSEFKNGMAWVLIGGLTSSFLLTLFIVPAMYMVMDNLRERFSKKVVTEKAVNRN
ncbi:MAG: acriflavin resistance protein [Flavobacterium psychrophilum]|nr:MAG: acriflavin resistance protein [Flavobacterium psychrophilum]